MRGYLIVHGLFIVTIGIAGKFMLVERNESYSFLQGGLTLGGALIICGLFAGMHHRLGMIGGGIIALLGFCRTMVNLTSWAEWLSHKSPRPPATPLLEILVAILLLTIMIRVVRTLQADRALKISDGNLP